MTAPPHIRAAAELELRRRKRARATARDSLTPGVDEPFRAWCTRLAAAGLMVDGRPFSLEDRPALHAIYDLIPTTPADAFDRMIVLMKGSQMGLTVWEVLADLYMALKWEPVTIGLYVPDSKLAPYKSEHRFMRVVRSLPAVHQRMTEPQPGHARRGEGNVLTRTLGESILLFLWTSGATMTESFPADVVSFDEVQNMTPGDITKVCERLSASRVRLTLLLSTPKWPDSDIHFWYARGTQHEFHTACLACGAAVVLDHFIPEQMAMVIRWDPDFGAYRYACPTCGAWINDPQQGEWRALYPERKILSYHLSQVLSPTVAPGDLITAWGMAQTGEQRASFYNRKIGKPYADPSQIPVTREHLNACAAAGAAAGVTWKTSARETFMGIDQMGGFNCVLIKERLPDGRQALIHAEAVFDLDPFSRCAALLQQYGVAVCVVEGLPNWNDAKKFANAHPGRVFVASYGDQTDTQVWGDQLARGDYKTDQEERDRWTVRLNQYKAMQASLARITGSACLFPDPGGLECEYRDGPPRRVLLLRDIIFEHLTKVALISERDGETGKWRTRVAKVGIDPHFAYANMLCDVAWARAYGGAAIWMPESPAAPPSDALARLHDRVTAQHPEGACGSCSAFTDGQCTARGLVVRETDPGCALWLP
jgi:hypothetical protein